MSYRFREFAISDRMMGAIERYVQQRIKPGDFLTAVIRNDLFEAVGRADDENMANLSAFVAYFYNVAPSSCWGSSEKMHAWLHPEEVTA